MSIRTVDPGGLSIPTPKAYHYHCLASARLFRYAQQHDINVMGPNEHQTLVLLNPGSGQPFMFWPASITKADNTRRFATHCHF